MKYIIIILSLNLLLLSCNGKTEETTFDEINEEPSVNTEVQNNEIIEPVTTDSQNAYSLKTTFSPEHGWGYQILNNEEMYINQPHIPSFPGNNGFDSEEKAITTAQYIIYKLDNGFFPPTISPEELDSLGVM